MKTLQLTLEQAIEVCKALSNEHRMKILRILSESPHNVNELAEKMNMPFSTIAVNVKKLEDAGIISTELIPGRGTQKVNTKKYDRIIINLFHEEETNQENTITIEMPIGEYVDCEVEQSCGLVDENNYIGIQDDPRSFYETKRKQAQLLYFRVGYVEYRFPNRIPYGTLAKEVEFSAEICSEAPYHKLDWPSDITCWVNGIEIGTWTCPGDFGGERGLLTPKWWPVNNTQYGLLKHWKVTEKGCYLDGVKISDVTIEELVIHQKPFISFRLAVKKDAVNVGGVNIFGSKFGNYEQSLVMKIHYENQGNVNNV